MDRKDNTLSASDEDLHEALRKAHDRIKELEVAEAEWKHSEEALKEVNANLSALIENTSDYILFSDSEARPVIFNSAYAAVMKQMLGLDMAPGIRPHELLQDPEARALWDDYHRRVLSGEHFTSEFTHRGPEGELLHFEVSFNPVVKDNKVVGFSEYTRDITQRKRAVNELRQAHDRLEEQVAERTHELFDSERRLRRAQRIARLGSWEANLETLTSTWSEEIYELLKVEPGRTIDRETFRDLVHPDDLMMVFDGVKNSETTGEPYDQEVRFICPDSEERIVHSVAEVECDDRGRPVRLVGIMQDVTERKLAEEEQQRLERQVLQSQKLESLGVLTGGIAHDFNNLLMAIIGNADLALLELQPDSSIHSNIESIISTALKASKLTSQMLAYAGKGRFQVRPHDLNAIVSKMSHLLKSSVSKKAELSYQLTPGLPPIAADAAQLRQIVLNLVTNADEALDEEMGSITIRTALRPIENSDLDKIMSFQKALEGTHVVLEVEDTGCGMDEETKARVFEPFFSTKFAGRGLGLAAVQGIVRGSSGALEVISRPGDGSVFRIYFRMLESEKAQRTPELESADEWRGSGVVLLVDDELPVRDAAQQMLERLGFDVIIAADGVEAIEQYRKHIEQVRCVVLDLQMPQMDGAEAFGAIRDIRNDIPVILSSGYGEEEAMQRFADRGISDFIQKPYRLATLGEKLRGVLRSRSH